MTSGLLVMAAGLHGWSDSCRLSSCPFPPTPFPSRSWHPPSAAALASDVIPPLWSGAAIFYFFFHLQIGSIFEVVTLPLALVVHLSLLVCVCEAEWQRWIKVIVVRVSVQPQCNVLLTQADMQIQWIFQTITGFRALTAIVCCMCVLVNMAT